MLLQRSILSAIPLMRVRVASTLAALCLLAACTSHFGPAAHQHGRAYAGPTQFYPPPGTPEDPWGPYIREASGRFGVPEQWIREVMRQESNGQEQAVSSAGAMGLMQIMPDTFDDLRQRYTLGSDPFEPYDNIMAGAAYIREMYDRYGAPGFLAAYNAGPYRLDSYLGGSNSLPDETVNYVASIAPRLGGSVRMTGPLAVYAQSGNMGQDSAVPVGQVTAPVAVASRAGEACDQDAAYEPDRPCTPTRTLGAAAPVVVKTASWCDPDAAYDPSHPCPRTTSSRHSGRSRGCCFAVLALPASSACRLGQRSCGNRTGNIDISNGKRRRLGDPSWCIRQSGAGARDRRRRSRGTRRSPNLCSDRAFADLRPLAGGYLYRARLSNLSANTANAACARLAASQQPCMVVAPGQAL